MSEPADALDDLVFRYFEGSGAAGFENLWDTSAASASVDRLEDLLVFSPENSSRRAFVDWLYFWDVLALHGALGIIPPLTGPDWQRRLSILHSPDVRATVAASVRPLRRIGRDGTFEPVQTDDAAAAARGLSTVLFINDRLRANPAVAQFLLALRRESDDVHFAESLPLVAAPNLLASEVVATAGGGALPPVVAVIEGAAAYIDHVTEMRAVMERHSGGFGLEWEVWECHMCSLMVSPWQVADTLVGFLESQLALTRTASPSLRQQVADTSRETQELKDRLEFLPLFGIDGMPPVIRSGKSGALAQATDYFAERFVRSMLAHAELIAAVLADPGSATEALELVTQSVRPEPGESAMRQFLTSRLGSTRLGEKLAILGLDVNRLVFVTSPDGQMHVSEAALLGASTAMPQATVLERRDVVIRVLGDNVKNHTIGEIDRLLDSGSPIPTLVLGREGDIEVTNPVSPDDSVRVITIQKASFELLAPALRIAFGEDIDPVAGAPVQWVNLDANEMLVLLTPEQTARVQARLDSVRTAAESTRWADDRNRLDREATFLTPRAGLVVAPPELLSQMSLSLADGFWPSRQGVVLDYETAAKKALGESSKPAAVIIRDALTTPRDGPDPNWRRPASAVVTLEEALPTLSSAWSLAAKWAGVLNAWLASPGQVENVVRAANVQSDRIARQAWSTPPTPRSRSVGTNE